MEVPRDCRDECGSKLWTTLLIHLEIDGDQDLGAGLLRKRPNEFAMNWGHKTVLILEFTCAFDSRANRYTLADQHKTDRYSALRNRLQACLGSGWSVDIMSFSTGMKPDLRVIR